MSKKNIGLILEGGGMRGAYTAGVLDAFLDNKIRFPYVIGVSAGANNGANFISEQRGRSKRIFVDWVKDKRFLGLSNFFREGSYFGMDFLFDKLPNELDPFDYNTFYNSPITYKVCITNCESGEPAYFEYKDFEQKDYFMKKVLRASSSLPIISPTVEINNRHYLDGGIADPIPIEKSISDGNSFNVIVLTRNEDYRKKPSKLTYLNKFFLYKYPNLVDTLKNRHSIYNNSLEKISLLQKNGEAFIFRPEEKIAVDRMERDTSKLDELYQQGYNETINQMSDFNQWLKSIKDDSSKKSNYLCTFPRLSRIITNYNISNH